MQNIPKEQEEGRMPMCGRYFTGDKDTPQEMQAILDALSRRETPPKSGEVYPADTAAVGPCVRLYT